MATECTYTRGSKADSAVVILFGPGTVYKANIYVSLYCFVLLAKIQ